MLLLPNPKSIRQRFTYSLAMVVGGTLVILSIIFIVYNNKYLEKELHVRLDNLTQLVSNGLSSALWQYNYEYIDDYVDSLFQDEDIVFAGVYADNQLIKKKVREELAEKDVGYFAASTAFIMEQADILYQDSVIGQFTLVMSVDRINRMTMRSSILSILVLSLIISGIFFTMFVLSRKHLFKPLTQLESSARSISKGQLDTVIDTSSEDEIGNLARVFDQMMKDLTSTMASRDELEAEITERKRMEELLGNREQLLNEMGQIAKIGGWEHNLIDNNAIWTEEVYTIMELNQGPIPGPDEHLKYYPPKDRAILEKAYQRAVNTGEQFDLELQSTTAKGRLFWSRVIGHPEFDNGQCVRIKGTFQDITKLKRLEENLRHAQKMESIGTLAGGIAHDFNNILAAILGYAEMVQMDCQAGSTMRERIDRVIEAGLRAKGLVKQILAFSRQTESEDTILQPALIIKETVKLLRSSLPTTIEIVLNIDPAAGQIKADPTHIHQILTNLCTNASHAMEETGGTLTISLKNRELSESDLISDPHVRSGHFVLISVEDTGPGIAPEIMGNIFDPFFTTKDVGKGTGMGLSIIHGIVKKAGGFISFQSSPNEGTTFYVYLPIYNSTSPAEVTNIPFDLIPLGNERILFIDDEEMVAELAQIMLEPLGYRVSIETNSVHALQTIESQPDQFDLIVTDQTMPGITGIELASRILQIQPAMPIIICTGFSNQISEEQAKLHGIKGFAMKPLSRKDLANLIRTVLDGAS